MGCCSSGSNEPKPNNQAGSDTPHQPESGNIIRFLTMQDCHSCAAAKAIFDEVMPDFPDVKVEEMDIASEEGQKLCGQYGIMASPGIIINGELFSSGGVDKDKLTEKLKSLSVA